MRKFACLCLVVCFVLCITVVPVMATVSNMSTTPQDPSKYRVLQPWWWHLGFPECPRGGGAGGRLHCLRM